MMHVKNRQQPQKE